ncbi:MAG: VOC family protein [Betaproteobacteria bacterium]
MRTEIDHLVVACRDLDHCTDWARATLGVEPQPGGKHATMGTHNRLLKLGPRVYLELIAIDPEAPAPARPRWFGLDRADVQARAAREPVLLAWVGSCDDITAAVTAVPLLGEVLPFTRNAYAWRFALTAHGELNYDGVLPPLIQWDSDAHPCDALEDRGCKLLSLELTHPDAAAILPLFRKLRIAGPVELAAGPPALRARLRVADGGERVLGG